MTSSTIPVAPSNEASLPTCPLSPGGDAMALLDHTARRDLVGAKDHGPEFTDALLDLRKSFSRFRTHPEEALRSWFATREILSKGDYLTAFRLRRLLERQVQVVVGSGRKEAFLPLDLRWKSIGHLMNYHRREIFEMSGDEVDFESIPVAFRWVSPL